MDDLIIVDRIESGEAVCEMGDAALVLPLHLLPTGVREGDVLTQNDGGWAIDAAATEQRRRGAGERFKRLFPKNK